MKFSRISCLKIDGLMVMIIIVGGVTSPSIQDFILNRAMVAHTECRQTVSTCSLRDSSGSVPAAIANLSAKIAIIPTGNTITI